MNRLALSKPIDTLLMEKNAIVSGDLPLICFILAACICVVGAGFSVRFVEEATKNAINQSLKRRD